MNRKHSSERGNSILEFALVASLFLVPMLAGSYTMGMALVKMLQVGQVARDANILVVRGIDLSQSDNQSLVVKTASGLGMNVAGSNTPSTSGLGVVILTTIRLVSGTDCAAQGYAASGTLADGEPNYPTCPNFLKYVFTQRIVIGNSAKLTSVTGNPGDTLASNGTLSAAQYVTDTVDQAQGFPGLVTLTEGTNAYIAESAFDISAMNVFATPQMGIIYARNIS
jgi:Flp pilus assembly protein TadG